MITVVTATFFSLRAGPHHWSISMIATHIVATQVWWFLWMGEGKSDLAPIAHWDEKGHPVRNAAELVSGLEVTWRVIADALPRWTPADLSQRFSSPFSREEKQKSVTEYSRQWIIFHVLEHKIHHGSELSLALGMYSLTALYDEHE